MLTIKFEGNNTSGSHKLNSAIAQAYYAKQQGLTGVTTETGAGQWGTALSMACAYLGLDCKVFMVKCSYEQKPFRREVMRTYGASVTPSPSESTNVGRKILAEHPGTTGSLGCASFAAAEQFARVEGILPAPESSHAIRVAIDEALKCKETGEEKTILFGLTGTGYFDLVAYEKFNNGEMGDYIPTDEDILEGLKGIPQFPGNKI